MEDNKKIEQKKPEAPKKADSSKELIAVIRIRGGIGVNGKIIDTLKMLSLFKKNYCVVVPNTPSMEGMIKKCKDYITWGEIDEATLKILLDKKAEKSSTDPKKTKKFFRLSPPLGGFERKGIKTSFVSGGALGYRGKKVNDLIKKMIH